MGLDTPHAAGRGREDALWTARLTVEVLEAGRLDLYRRRHAHVLAHMRRAGAAVLLLLDSNDITYATGARNMTLFTMRTPARCLLILESGHTVLFEYVGCEHLARGLPTIEDIRPAEGLDIVSSGGRVAGSWLASPPASRRRSATSTPASTASTSTGSPGRRPTRSDARDLRWPMPTRC
jgi:hypothetical protein